MLHSIEDVIRRIDVMKDKAIELHRVRNQYSELSGKTYDKDIANSLLDDIQSLALVLQWINRVMKLKQKWIIKSYDKCKDNS